MLEQEQVHDASSVGAEAGEGVTELDTPGLLDGDRVAKEAGKGLLLSDAGGTGVALADVDANVQVAASAALQQAVARGHGQLVVEQLLRRALHDASTDVRESCMLCLMQPNFISEPRVIECMCSLAPGGSRSAEPSLRRLAVLGLGRVGEIWAAVAGIDDTDVTVRTASAHVACEARGIVVSTQGLRPKTIPPVLSQETETQIEGILFKALQDWDHDLRALGGEHLCDPLSYTFGPTGHDDRATFYGFQHFSTSGIIVKLSAPACHGLSGRTRISKTRSN